jgi:DNA-binding SARP family transcriptional activator
MPSRSLHEHLWVRAFLTALERSEVPLGTLEIPAKVAEKAVNHFRAWQATEPTKTPMDLFLQAWTLAAGDEGYDKEAWRDAQRILEQANQHRVGHDPSA